MRTPVLATVMISLVQGCMLGTEDSSGTNPSDCGGRTCSHDQVCVSNQCECAYGDQTACGSDGCVYLDSDTDNCGSCGRSCAYGEVCASGTCGCPQQGQMLCDGTCIDVQYDRYNCGACGHDCENLSNMSVSCESGACVNGGCDSGYRDCNGSASDGCEAYTSADESNCGACGHACPGSQWCDGGTCRDRAECKASCGSDDECYPNVCVGTDSGYKCLPQECRDCFQQTGAHVCHSDPTSCDFIKCEEAGSTGGTAQPGDPCANTVDCTPGSICWNQICVGDGALRFSLSWTADTDFDLHVVTPSGTEIYYSNPSGNGGVLDVDDCVGGACTVPNGVHVENVYWTSSPPSGSYKYWVRNYDGDMSGQFQIEVSRGGSVIASKSGTLPASVTDSTHYTLTP